MSKTYPCIVNDIPCRVRLSNKKQINLSITDIEDYPFNYLCKSYICTYSFYKTIKIPWKIKELYQETISWNKYAKIPEILTKSVGNFIRVSAFIDNKCYDFNPEVCFYRTLTNSTTENNIKLRLSKSTFIVYTSLDKLGIPNNFVCFARIRDYKSILIMNIIKNDKLSRNPNIFYSLPKDIIYTIISYLHKEYLEPRFIITSC